MPFLFKYAMIGRADIFTRVCNKRALTQLVIKRLQAFVWAFSNGLTQEEIVFNESNYFLSRV